MDYLNHVPPLLFVDGVHVPLGEALAVSPLLPHLTLILPCTQVTVTLLHSHTHTHTHARTPTALTGHISTSSSLAGIEEDVRLVHGVALLQQRCLERRNQMHCMSVGSVYRYTTTIVSTLAT